MRKRLEYMDIVRGICIIYMIGGHIGYDSVNFDNYIHAFHMPIFFLLSGFFYKEKQESILKYGKRLAKKLLIPYFVWAIFALIVDNYTLLGKNRGLRQGLKIILTTNHNEIPIAGALWFLTSFFICNIIFKVTDKYIKNDRIKAVLNIIIMIAGIYLEKIWQISLWWSTNSALVGVGLMTIGYWIKKNKWVDFLTIKNNILFWILSIFHVFLIMKSGYVNMRLNIYPNIFLFLINVVFSFIIYMNIGKKIEKIVFLNRLTGSIKLLGKDSMIPLCLNQLIILFYNALILDKLVNFLPNLCIIILRLLMTVITIIIIIKKLSNKKIKFLFGQ